MTDRKTTDFGLKAALDGLLTTIYPPACAACDTPLNQRQNHGLCETCHEVLSPNIGPRCGTCDHPKQASSCPRCLQLSLHPLQQIRSPFLYGGPLQTVLTRLKFENREDFAPKLACLVAQDRQVQILAQEATCLVPVPLGRKRRHQRGYNQSGLLAQALSKHLQLPVRYELTRTVETPPQSELTLQERIKNVQNVFQAEPQLQGEHVLLVDDVTTTCSTLRDAARALMAAGCSSVKALTCARTVL